MGRQYTEHEQAQAKMMLRFYNLQAGTMRRLGELKNYDSNFNCILRGLDAVSFDGAVARQHVKVFVQNEQGEHSLPGMLQGIGGEPQKAVRAGRESCRCRSARTDRSADSGAGNGCD